MSNIFHKIGDKFERAKTKMGDQVDELQGDLSRLKVAAATTWNPNHRHDEEHEKEQDRMRQEILDKHRYKSFADVREGNDVKWYIDGHDYFWALSEILEEARETIWILDWWLSPELYLRRPPMQNEQWRLDRILKRKAEQGVKVYVIVYKEVNATMTLNSKYTKHALEELHPNISVQRHPDHSGGEIVMYWSHHEKVVLIDNAIACIGGLDLCYGRWDTHNFPLADAYPDSLRSTLFPGQDYNNSRVADFENVQAWAGNQQARLELPRMPWHDIHCQIVGPAVMDIAQHFVERWNFSRDLKYRHMDRFPLLGKLQAWPHDDPLNDQMLRHPHTARLRQLGHRFSAQRVHLDSRPKGNMRVQICRSVGDWSCGWLTEQSIQNAYIQSIREANHFILIENQFFISIPGAPGPAKNEIATALVERILSAARAGEKFKVIVIIPEIPCFPGDLKASAGTLLIIGAQYRSLCRGKDSIFGKIEAAGYNPRDYITLFNLRQWDRIKYDPDVIHKMEQDSGVLWGQVLAAMARVNIGDNPPELEKDNNATLRFKPMKYGDAVNTAESGKNKKGEIDIQTIDLPASVGEAIETLEQWENSAPPELRNIAGTIARNTLQSGRSVLDEPWFGASEKSEKNSFVTEELYIHSKLLIVDDRKVICGSANLNDRSQRGDRDSEIVMVIEDNEMIESQMDGRKFMASRFAATLRRRLFRQHLGLIPPQDCPGPVTAAMKSVGTPYEYDFGSPEDLVVQDPLSDEFHALWNTTAATNAAIYQELFHCVPAKGIRTWEQYKSWVPADKPVGHIANQDRLELSYIKERLSKIRGHLVEMPTDFLEDERLWELTAEVNPITLPIYL